MPGKKIDKSYFIIVTCIFISSCLGSPINIKDDLFSNRDPFEQPMATKGNLTSDKQQNLISLNFRNIEVRDLLQLLAEYKNINIIVSDAVKGNISLRLNNVTWQQALQTVLTIQGLVSRESGNIILVETNAEFALQQKQNPSLEQNTTVVMPIYYAKAEELATMLQNKATGLLSAQGTVISEPRTNSLLVNDNSNKILQIKRLIKQLDIPAKQVMITARIVNVDENFLQDLGIKFGTIPINNNTSFDNLTMNMPTTVPQEGRFNIAIAKLGQSALLDLELSALASEGHAKIISNPKLITANRQTAVIESGQEIPYQEKTSSGATNVAFKKAVLSLRVTPEITPNNRVLLNLAVNQDKISAMMVNGVPAINTQEIQTQIVVNNGETIVLGGIYEQVHRQMVTRVPFLAAIPGLGVLFRNKQIVTERKELLIFVTPKIVGEKA